MFDWALRLIGGYWKRRAEAAEVRLEDYDSNYSVAVSRVARAENECARLEAELSELKRQRGQRIEELEAELHAVGLERDVTKDQLRAVESELDRVTEERDQAWRGIEGAWRGIVRRVADEATEDEVTKDEVTKDEPSPAAATDLVQCNAWDGCPTDCSHRELHERRGDVCCNWYCQRVNHVVNCIPVEETTDPTAAEQVCKCTGFDEPEDWTE